MCRRGCWRPTYLHTVAGIPEQSRAVPLLAVADHGQLGDLAPVLGSGRVGAIAVLAVVAVGVCVHGG